MRYRAFAAAGAVVLFGLGLLTLTGCGGLTNASGGGGATTPTVTVSASPSSITTAQGTTVTVTVSGSSGNPMPTGSVTLTSGSYSSGAVTLSGGSAQITIPAGSLVVGTDALAAAYTPDANSSSTYNSATGTGSVTVSALITPTVTVSASPSSITTAQGTTVTVTVSGGSGTPTGSVTLTSGSYSSGAVTLSGVAQIVVQGSALATGSDTLTAAYTPDANGSLTYNSASGTGSVTVTVLAITSFTANPNPIPYGSTSTQLTAVFTGGSGAITAGTTTISSSVISGTPVTVSPTGTTVYTLTVTPTSGTPITQTVSASLGSAGVTVNPANPGIAVTDQVLGMNMAVWYDFTNSGAYTASNSPIVGAFKDAGIAALRWPGGSTSDVYHWNGSSGTGTGVPSNPANGAAPSPSACDSQYQNSNTDYLNFINGLENAITNGFDVALTADYGSNPACTGGGDPHEAANWVTYAYANGGTVSRMTVGNEEYGNWEYDLHAIKNDPTTYAAAVDGSDGLGGYYTLIKNASAAANGNTLVGVVVDADNTTGGWDNTVLANAKGSYDFVEYHYYPETPGAENDTTLIQQDAHNLTTNVNTIKLELTKWGTPNTPIYVGEIGAPYSNPGKQSWSITQGLYAGQVLGEMMNDGVSRLTWWIGFGNCNGDEGNDTSSVYGWQNFGAYNVFSDGSGDTGGANNSPCDYGGNGNTVGAMSPTAVAFDLFSNVAVNGEHVLTPVLSGDTTDVVAYAATHSGGTAIVLFNRNETTSEPVTITVTDESSSPGVTWYTFGKEMYDYTNTSCDTAPTCTVDPNHDYSTIDWASPATTAMGSQTLPLTVTLAPWSMNVFIIQ